MSKRVFFWGLFFVLIIIGALMWLGRVKFEIKNQLGIKLNVSQISGNIFLLKSGYWKKNKKIEIFYTSDQQRGNLLVDAETKKVISSVYIDESSQKTSLIVHYDSEFFPKLVEQPGRLSRDVMLYLCMYFENTNNRDLCGQRARDFEVWSKKFTLPELIKINKSKILSLVGRVYAACSGTVNCGSLEATCTCGSSSYNSQCDSNCTDCCGPLPNKNAYDCSCSSDCTGTGGHSNDCSSISSESVCKSISPINCGIGFCRLADYPCDWCTPVDGGWVSVGVCYVGGGDLCIKNRTCTNPSPSCGGSDCTGVNYTECPVTCAGNDSGDCPTYCDYDGGTLQGSRDGCGCSTITCSATADCCTATNPEAPSLSLPVDGAVVASPVGLSWLEPSSWGQECLCTGTRNYQVCVSATNSVNPCTTGITASNLTGLSYSYVQSVSGLYYWTVRAVNKCGNVSAIAPVRSFRINSAPTFISLTIKNADNAVVVGESGGTTVRNHICQTTFQNSTIPRRIIFEANINDADGAANISNTATLTWNGRNYTMTKGYSAGTGATMVATVDFGDSDNATGVYDLSVMATDIYSATTGLVDTNRDLKVWSCQVPVLGTLYDDSSQSAGCTSD